MARLSRADPTTDAAACVGVEFSPFPRSVCRWVRQDMSGKRDFPPTSKTSPDRALSPRVSSWAFMKHRQMNNVWSRRIKERSVMELVMTVGRWYPHPTRLSVPASDPMSQSPRPRGIRLLFRSWCHLQPLPLVSCESRTDGVAEW